MFVALELKKSAHEAEDRLQEHNIDLINKAKGIGLKVSPENWEKVYKVLQTLSKGEHHDRINLGTSF